MIHVLLLILDLLWLKTSLRNSGSWCHFQFSPQILAGNLLRVFTLFFFFFILTELNYLVYVQM